MKNRNKTALVLGASGLIGKELIQILIQQNNYEKIYLLGRRLIEVDEDICQQHIVHFDELHKHKELFNVTDVFCCLGTTMKKAKTKDAFRKVDYDYPLAAAKLASETGVEKFLIVTAMGANSKSMFFYNQVKGQVESALSMVNLPSLFIFRPSLLLGERDEHRFGEKIAEKASKFLNSFLVGPLRPYRAIQAKKVAVAMAVVAQSNNTGKHIYLSHEIDQMVGLSVWKKLS